MKKLSVLLACFLAASLAYPTYIIAQPDAGPSKEQPKKSPRDLFEFGKDGKVIPKSDKPARTFNFPPLKTGFIIDFKNLDIMPFLGLELKEWDIGKHTFNLDLGVAQSRVFMSVGWEFIPIINIGPTIWAGYNLVENDYAVGVGVMMLDF